MNQPSLALSVAWWEFRRFFKFRDQLVAFFLAMGAVFALWGIHELAQRSEREKIRIAILNPEVLAVQLPADSRFIIEPTSGKDATALRDAIGKKELDGLLIFRDTDSAELVVYKEPYWEKELEEALTTARRTHKLTVAQLSADKLLEVLAPVRVEVVYDRAGKKPASDADKTCAAVFIVLTVIGVTTGLAFFFIGITGEKRLRVTEQVVAAIAPQTWIDGKILGISALIYALMLNLGLANLAMIGLLKLFGADVYLPVALGSPLLLAGFLVLAILGTLLWNCLFAGFAATINDPNTSTRGALMWLCVIPVLITSQSLANPDSTIMRVLSLVPGTSSSALPARLVLTEVAIWEFPVAVILLLAAIWIIRKGAGKVFAISILMYGKEPSIREIWNCLRET